MDIDTETIHRVRDALLFKGREKAEGMAGQADKHFAHEQDLLERFSPFAETMFIMALADGREAPEELDALRGAMHMLTANELHDGALTDIYQRCKHNLAEWGLRAYLERIGSEIGADRMDRETAFTLAAAVALADNDVDGAELEHMQEIAECFGISNSASRRLLSAM
ncbi:MAG: TerB family tellurite resistance protein [Pseudomonadota bacterium]